MPAKGYRRHEGGALEAVDFNGLLADHPSQGNGEQHEN